MLPDDRGACLQGFQFTEQSLWEASKASGDAESSSPSFANYQIFERELSRQLMALLDSSKSVKPALSLAEQFKRLGAKHFRTKEVLGKLVEAGQIQLAIHWAGQSGHDMQVGHLFCMHALFDHLLFDLLSRSFCPWQCCNHAPPSAWRA
jgi:hypothetical protein